MDNLRQLPLLPLRDVVVYPGCDAPIYIGRDASLRAIRAAMDGYGEEIAVFTQIRGEDNGPLAMTDIHRVGTIARIAAKVRMTDDTVKGMLEGKERVRLVEMREVDGVTLLTVAPEPEPVEHGEINASERDAVLSMLTRWGLDVRHTGESIELKALANGLDLVTVVSSLRSLLRVPRIEKPGTERPWTDVFDGKLARYRDLRNEAVARRQRVLEAADFRTKLQLAMEALEFDVACWAETF